MALSQDVLRQELEAEQGKLASTRKRRESAEREEQSISARVEALRVLLGTDGSNGSDASASDSSASDSSDSTTSQRAHMRAALNAAGTRGLAPRDLFRAVEKYGIKKNYVHSTLFRWKEDGTVTEQGGRYSLSQVQ